jgi:superfamily II DNA/RNA helicase
MSISTLNPESIIKKMGFSALNDVQKQTISVAKKNANIQLIAPTGSGKTLAFCLAALQTIEDEPGIQCLIIAPTRELVIQIESVLKAMKLGVKVNAAYGGHGFAIERQNFTDPPTFLVGTPGRLEDHLNRKTFSPDTITHVIFDEYDKSLEFGFEAEMTSIMRRLKFVERLTLVSATSDIDIPKFLNINDLKKVDFSGYEKNDKITYQKLTVAEDEKLEGLVTVLSALKKGQNAIVFVNHRDAADRIGDYFRRLDVKFSVFHGGLVQDQRELELIKFRNGSTNVLVATDIAGRGIDIPELNYVIHYQMPTNDATFVHRNGRTARVDASGNVVLLMTEGDKYPDFVDRKIPDFKINEEATIPQPKWTTLFIGKGKKDKINKMDIVGYFTKFSFIEKHDLGLIEVLDFVAYIAISSDKVDQLLKNGNKAKIKGKTVKVERVNVNK